MLESLQEEGAGDDFPVCELCEAAMASLIDEHFFLCHSCSDYLSKVGDCKMTDGTTTEHATFAVGDVVILHDLRGATELNGRWGQVVSFVEATQRYGVKLAGRDAACAVRPVNLLRAR